MWIDKDGYYVGQETEVTLNDGQVLKYVGCFKEAPDAHDYAKLLNSDQSGFDGNEGGLKSCLIHA